MYLVQGTTANSAGNPTFTQLTTGAATIGSIGNTAFGATQSGTWTIQPGNTANTTPWLVTVNQGSNSQVVKAASTAAAQTDPAAVVRNSDLGTISDTAWSGSGNGTSIAIEKAIEANTAAAVPAGTNLIGNVGQVYPAGSTAITASATGTTAATTATLAANASLHTWICGFSIRANATAAATGNATVTGTVTGTMNWTQWTAPNASGLGVTEEVFSPCIESSAVNTGIAVISAAPGTGGVVSVSAWGFQL
jgi:hypothetical protein